MNESPKDTPQAPPEAQAGVSIKKGWQRRYRLFLGLARAALMWERLWPCLWPAVGVAAVFISVALLDWLPMLPFWVHSLVLIVFACAFGFMVRGAAQGFKTVDEKSAQHRLELDSGLSHRPLMALHDRLAIGADDSGAQSLWRVHLGRAAKAVKKLRVSLPSPGLARFDPFALRAVVLLLLIIAVAAGGGDAGARLERALVPRAEIGGGGPLELDVWITPPAYTGLAPMFLEPPIMTAAAGDDAEDGEGQAPPTIQVPVGSVLLAQAGGTGDAPILKIGAKVIQFAAVGKTGEETENGGSYRVETILEDADRAADTLEVTVRGRPLGRWALRVVADRPPEVEFTRAPSGAGRAQLQVAYEARDDYGLAGLQVVIRHPKGRAVPGGRPAIRAELPLPGLGSKKVEGSSRQDFSAHPWAGLPVLVQLQAIDARGQAGQSDIITIILPERIFNHPVARAIAEARKKLSTPDDDVVAEVVEALNDIASRPKHFFDDTIVFLALSVAASRLIHDGSDAGIGTVQTLLWETMLRIEDGEFALAERDLKEIQDRLMRALRDGKDSAEIERLLDELSQALDKYMAALAEHLAKQGLAQLPANPTSRFLDSTDLQRIIEEARELARTGSLESARRMLSELRRMLEGIRNGLQRGQPRQDLVKAREMMDSLRKLTDRQRRELDKTFKRRQQSQGALRARPEPGGRQKGQSQGKGQGDRQGEDLGAGARRQQVLRLDLGRLMLRMDEFFGDIPSAFGKADRAMNDAVQALAKDRYGDAVSNQTEALEQLRRGMNATAERIARRMGGAFGVARGRRGQPPGEGNDPFGRRLGGAFGSTIDDGNVKIPTHMERRRAREILHELRRRAGEHQRPVMERQYIDRLLKRF
ncbi:MAG: TIGR02302 family protein [Proteobacteria bacterium]|nr:TIGR02302 family protein [Pseudomonadota bacterium]